MSWQDYIPYIFLLFSLVDKVINKIVEDQVEKKPSLEKTILFSVVVGYVLIFCQVTKAQGSFDVTAQWKYQPPLSLSSDPRCCRIRADAAESKPFTKNCTDFTRLTGTRYQKKSKSMPG